MWCSSILAIERTLLELFFFRLFGMTRKHAIIILFTILIFCTCGRIATILSKTIVPDTNDEGLFKCGYLVDINLLNNVEVVFVWINAGGTCFLHFLCNILTLISIARRKIYLSTGKLTCWNAWCTQIRIHRDYFIPPTVILLSQLAPMLFFEVGRQHACLEPKLNIWSHMHLFASFMNYVPQSTTFLIFVYSSKPYMKEFYSNTFVGKWIVKFKEKFTRHSENSASV
ncbi:unnamed protein product [Rotaria sp. Silwood1]|nr:unnamed protein product [Rotaria sp. Silwood1]